MKSKTILLYYQDVLCGMIESRLKYVADTQNRVQEVDESLLDLSINEPVHLDFFKTCYYDKNDKRKCELIKKKLKKTVKERTSLLKNNRKLDLKLHFPCMILNVDLVSGFNNNHFTLHF